MSCMFQLGVMLVLKGKSDYKVVLCKLVEIFYNLHFLKQLCAKMVLLSVLKRLKSSAAGKI